MQLKWMCLGLIGVMSAACMPAALAEVPAALTAQASRHTEDAGFMTLSRWRQQMVATPPSTAGCFHARYPYTSLAAVPCKPASARLMGLPSNLHGISKTAGKGNDYVLRAPSSVLLKRTTGSFPVETGVTSVDDSRYGPNRYSLQLNTNHGDATPACVVLSASCIGIQEQFAYSFDPGNSGIFIEYWMYGDFLSSGCPKHWHGLRYYCSKWSTTVPTPDVPINELDKVQMSAYANSAGQDGIVFLYGNDAYYLVADNPLGIDQVWTDSEFNVFGYGGGSQASLNLGSSLTVRVAALYKETNLSTYPPTCVMTGYTAESNNLNLGTCSAAGYPMPDAPLIQFTESN